MTENGNAPEQSGDYGERALAIAEQSPEVALSLDPGLTNKQKLELVKRTYGRDLSDAEFYLLITEAQHWGLDVFRREFGSIKFKGVAVNMPFRKGLAKLANQSPLMAGTDGPYWCGPDGHWREVWLETDPPAAAKYTVFRTDRPQFPVTRYAVWKERAQRDGNGALMPNWARMPAHMLAKVAETDALKASGLIDAGLLAKGVALDDPDDYDGTPRDDRTDRLRKAHAQAQHAGGHATVRATVQALNPEVESLTNASAEVLDQAGDLIATFGDKAPAVIRESEAEADAEYNPEYNAEFDPTTGEILPEGVSALEAWRITIREILDSQDRVAIKSLPDLAGDSPELWADLIAVTRIKEPVLGQWIKKARAAGISETVIDNALQRRDDSNAVSGERGRAAAAQFRQPPEMPERGEYSSADLFRGEAPSESD